MKKSGRCCLVVVGALLALSGQTVGPAVPEAHAATREARSVFPVQLPWRQSAKPVRKPRRGAKPAAPKPPAAKPAADKPAGDKPVAARPTPRETAPESVSGSVPLPRPAPEPKTGVAAVPEKPSENPETSAPPLQPPQAAETATPGSEQPRAGAAEAQQPDSEAAGAARAAEFANLRLAPTPEPPPLAPLPSEPKLEPVAPTGPIAYGVPLPPAKAALEEPEPSDHAAAPEPAEPQVAMTPHAPLNGPALPGPPDADTPPPVVAPAPSARDDDPDCKALAAENAAIATPLPALLGPGSCGAPLPVELTGVRLKDGSAVEIKPAAILRCETARAVAAYVRDDLAPAALAAGQTLTQVQTASSYICRGRNNRTNAKMSEHGLANALDIAGFAFKDGASFGVYAKELPETLSSVVKSAACERFNTVLGPGSDGFHEDHLHVDLRKRKSARSKLCRWSSS